MKPVNDPSIPLAERMRPNTLEEVVGQRHLLGAGRALERAVQQKKLHSMVLWGPPGVGKTSLAQLLARATECEFINLSAVLAGVKEIRTAVDQAAQTKRVAGRATLVFVDEVHRFNKIQQDAFLPHIENGTIIFIGATTENPSFELNNALLSRVRVYQLKSLTTDDLTQLIRRALEVERGLSGAGLTLTNEAQELLVDAADGDARRLLMLLELASDNADSGTVSFEAVVEAIGGNRVKRFDKGGDSFYDQISALHKSVRGSDPDAALYWFCRMLNGGADPLYLARRIVRIASEDVGNADPRALTLCLNAWDVQQRLGSPEGELALAQALVYLSVAPKSNAVYKAFKSVQALVAKTGSLEVPLHLRNAPTQTHKSIGAAQAYRYPHDYEDAFVAGETYLPQELLEQNADAPFYQPVERGLEIKIAEKMSRLRGLNREAQQ